MGQCAVVVRRLTVADEVEARRVAEITRPGDVSADLMPFLSKEHNFMMAAYVDGEFAGLALAYEMDRIYNGQPMMCLYDIGTEPQHRRKGVASTLINHLLHICRDKGLCQMWVITNESNEPAMSLYASTGGRRGDMDDVVFVYDTRS